MTAGKRVMSLAGLNGGEWRSSRDTHPKTLKEEGLQGEEILRWTEDRTKQRGKEVHRWN